MRSIEVSYDGQTLKVYARVRKGDSSKPWLVLLRGLQSNHQMFSTFFEDERFEEFSLAAIDLIGFGSSEKPENFSYDLMDQLKIVLQVTQNLGIARGGITPH